MPQAVQPRVQSVHPDDILIAIAHYLPPGRKCFKYGANKLNTFLYQQKQKHPELLHALLFDTNGTFPCCEEVYQAVSTLFASGLVVVASDKPWDYHFSPAAEASFREFARKRLSRQQQTELEKIAKEFNKQIAINESISFR